MHAINLDALGQRLVDLDDSDELYNCAAVLALAAKRVCEAADQPQFDRALIGLRLALLPFCDRPSGP